MANVLKVLSITLGLFFILLGTMKLGPIISESIYMEMRKVFIKDAKVFPLTVFAGIKINPQIYRRIVGSLEVVCGVMLAVIPGSLKQVANVILIVLMGLSSYTIVSLGDGLDKLTPSLIFGMLLICRLVIFVQTSVKDRKALMTSPREKSEKRSKVKKEN